MRKALVTGGCGFIGSSLAKKLVFEGWQVDVVDNMSSGKPMSLRPLTTRFLPNSNFIEPYYESLRSVNAQRLQNEILVIEANFDDDAMLAHIQSGAYDVVFHQAAIPRVQFSVENPSLTTYNNVFSTVKLFESCNGHVDRLVFASSSSIYGGANHRPTHESEKGENLPKSPYAWQKFTIEDYAKIATKLYDLDIVCLRYFNVFGPGQMGDSPYSTAVAAWCHATKYGFPLRSDGDGEQTRDMCYIDNVVHANILAANSDRSSFDGFKGRCYNIACGSSVSNRQILDYFRANFDVHVVNAPERIGDVKHTLANIDRAKEELGYEPLVSFWEGLEKTIDWWDLDDN